MYVPFEVQIKICCALVVTHVLLLHYGKINNVSPSVDRPLVHDHNAMCWDKFKKLAPLH